jgi:hypothetical protein
MPFDISLILKKAEELGHASEIKSTTNDQDETKVNAAAGLLAKYAQKMSSQFAAIESFSTKYKSIDTEDMISVCD